MVYMVLFHGFGFNLIAFILCFLKKVLVLIFFQVTNVVLEQ